MNLEQISKSLGWNKENNVESSAETDADKAYICDKLSTTLGNAKSGSILLTEESHTNMIAVGVHTEAAAIVICGGRKFDEATMTMATKGGLAIYSTPDRLFEASGKLYTLLVLNIKVTNL